MNDFLETLVIFESLLVIVLVGLFLYFLRIKNASSGDAGNTGNQHKQDNAPKLLDDILNAEEYGKIIFEADGALYMINSAARDFFCGLEDLSVESLTQQSFLNALYDHATDFDEIIRNTILSEYSREHAPEFIEVVQCDGGCFFLVEGRSVDNTMAIFTVIDISAGQKREESMLMLHEFNHQLMQAIQATTSGIIISDPKSPGNPILFANDAFCKFVSCKREELMSIGWVLLSYMFDGEGEKEAFFDALTKDDDAVFSLSLKDEKEARYYTMRLTPVYDDVGNVDMFVGVLTDVSLLKQRESEFFHAQKLESLGQLAAGVAHDFNNILSIIGGYSLMSRGLIGQEPFDSEKAISYLNKIEKASQRGAGLTQKMLTFSKHKVVTKNIVDVCEILKEQGELLEPLLGVNIKLNLDVPEDSLRVRGNIDCIGQIVMNLAINARDAMTDGGELEVSLLSVDEVDVPDAVSDKIAAEKYACIRVSDTGCGMDEETLEKVFDPFFSTKEQGKGTGLGLSVAYGLVQEMGGMIIADSVVGKGTNMLVYIPQTQGEKSKIIIGDGTDLSKICLDGYTALVAEDEPDLLLLVTTMLEDIGLNVISALNGNEALVKLEEHKGKIDILLTDVMMPEMDGVKLSELVTALVPSVYCIFMSGYPASGDRAPVELPEGAAFVAKPVHYEALVVLLFKKLKEGALGTRTAEMPYWETTKTQKVKTHG